MLFATKYNRQRIPVEFNSGEDLCERAGYIPAQTRIENLILAGRRLVQARQEMYDFPDGKVDPDFIDPTRSPGFDMADATALTQRLTSKQLQAKILKEQAEQKVKDDALKASQTSQDASDKA